MVVEIGGHPKELGIDLGFVAKNGTEALECLGAQLELGSWQVLFVGECVVRKVRHLCMRGVGGGTEGVLEMVEIVQQVFGPQHVQSLGIHVSQQFLVVEFVIVSKVIHTVSRVRSPRLKELPRHELTVTPCAIIVVVVVVAEARQE